MLKKPRGHKRRILNRQLARRSSLGPRAPAAFRPVAADRATAWQRICGNGNSSMPPLSILLPPITGFSSFAAAKPTGFPNGLGLTSGGSMSRTVSEAVRPRLRAAAGPGAWERRQEAGVSPVAARKHATKSHEPWQCCHIHTVPIPVPCSPAGTDVGADAVERGFTSSSGTGYW